MAFPTITSITETETASGTSHDVDYPATVAVGDLLLLFWSNDGSGSDVPTLPGDWNTNELQNGNHSAGGYAVSYLIADGTEGGSSFNVTTPSTEATYSFVVRILAANWHGTTPPEDVIGADATSNPDCGELAPSWGSDDTLWICWTARDHTNGTVDVWPLPDNQTLASTAGSQEPLAICSDELAQAALNPDAWTWGDTDNTIAGMVAVRPAAGVITASGGASIGAIEASGNAFVRTVKITDVNGDEEWTDGDTDIVITGSGFI